MRTSGIFVRANSGDYRGGRRHRSWKRSAPRLRHVSTITARGLMRPLLAFLLSLTCLSGAGQTSGARLLEVSFAGGRNIERDDGSGPYQAPHWRASVTEQHPYLIKAGDTLTIANAKFQVSGRIPGSLAVRGTRNDALNVPQTVASRVAGTTDIYQITDVPLAAPFRQNRIAFYARFEIRWEVSRDGASKWEPAGVSTNDIYVCLTDGSTVTPYLTTIHTACSR